MMLNSVVLPAPLGPTSPTSSPAWMPKVTSRSTTRPPKFMPMPSSCSMGSAGLRDARPTAATEFRRKPDDALRQEQDHHHDDNAQDHQPVELRDAQELGHGEKDQGADDRPAQRADAAHDPH